MASVRIALQPPPNVDFVVGYPGIPPSGRDRPSAAVKGAVEVRVGPAGAKARWVRVELKKIETLPGGGQANSCVDSVSTIPLWQSSEDYSALQTQDFPFLIRIPESTPPSIALERGAGIRYELVATVCTLGKKGFFRRRKTTVISQATTIIIDKHELHSTWPVYSQPESRTVFQDGIHLAVERGRTCYGPGDRVSVMAVLKSEAVHPVVLRGFEFTLKETTIFRPGPHTPSKRNGPQTKVANIGEQKVPLNATLYNGAQHKAELGCLIPNTHTTTTLNAARYIDITYVIIVRAWIGSMQSIMMELPVIVSNWPRNVSEEAIRRIGHAPSLCTASPSSPAATVPITTSITRSLTSGSYHQNGYSESGAPLRSPPVPAKQSPYNTVPAGYNGSANARLDADELGALGGSSAARVSGTIDHPGYGSSNRPTSRGGLGGIQEDSTRSGVGSESGHGHADSRVPGIGRRRGGSAHAHNRLTITNYSDKDVADGINPQVLRAPRPTTPPSRAAQKAWLTAEDEKKMLYDKAVARVQVVQGAAALASATAASDAPSSVTSATPTASKKPSPWPTAETEKVRLYEHAQATAKRTQAFGAPSPSICSRSSSEANSPSPREKPGSPSAGSGPTVSAGAALYHQAVSSISSSTNNGPGASLPSPSASRVPHYLSAEEEKAALKRYHEAKLAVDRNQNTQFGSGIAAGSSARGAGPLSYDSLFPEPDGVGETGASDMPPPFESSGSSGQPRYLNEKERLRRQYEAQDAAALAAQAQPRGPEPPLSPPSHIADAPSSPAERPSEESRPSEKEVLRRRLEEQDRVALALQQRQRRRQRQQEQEQEQEQAVVPPQTPPRVSGSRAPPVPPSMNGFKPLTAAEEKAQLRAKYEAEQQAAVNGHAEAPAPTPPPASRHPYAIATPTSEPLPPPLLPRPPAEYIQETQEADLRGRYYDTLGVGLAQALDTVGPSQTSYPQLDMRPFSPFDAGLGYDARSTMASPIPVRGSIRRPPPPPVSAILTSPPYHA